MIAADYYIINQACKLPNWGETKRFAKTILAYDGDGDKTSPDDKLDQRNFGGDVTIDGEKLLGFILLSV